MVPAKIFDEIFFKTISTHRDLSIAHVFVMFGPRHQVLPTPLTQGLSENLTIFGNLIDFGRKSGISSVENVAKHYSNHKKSSELDSVSLARYLQYTSQLIVIKNEHSPCFMMCSAEGAGRVRLRSLRGGYNSNPLVSLIIFLNDFPPLSIFPFIVDFSKNRS